MKYFVSGIHTDAGKSFCTGWFARKLIEQGKSVITQKFIQTGNVGLSEDIAVHRKIMQTGLLSEDTTPLSIPNKADSNIGNITAPLIFTHPCSPQLAAKLDNRNIDISVIDSAAEILNHRYDIVLIEGAGGLMVPINDEFLTIDYVTTRHLPLIMVVNSSLGSINHALLSFEAIKNRCIQMPFVLYNHYFDTDPLIAEDTFNFIKRYLSRNFAQTQLLEVLSIKS